MKDSLRKDKRVELLKNMEMIPVFSFGGREYTQKREEISTDGDIKITAPDSPQLVLENFNWLVLKKGGEIKVRVIEKWLDDVDITDKSFINLCLALENPGVQEVKFESKNSQLVKNHLIPIATHVCLNGISEGNYQLIIFAEDNKIVSKFSADKGKELLSFRDLGISDVLNIFKIKGFVIRI